MIRFPHPPIESGKILFLDYDDEIEKLIRQRHQVQGSYSKTISVRSTGCAGVGFAEYLSISGNPSKFLQGHNVFGSDDLLALVLDTVKLIDKDLNLEIDQNTYRDIRLGEYQISMIDINYSFALNNQQDVQAWIRTAEFKSRTRAGRPTTRPGTIYWQQHSRRWALKAYSKFQELQSTKAHQLPLQLRNTPLLPWTENILRIELRLLSLELNTLKLTKAKDLAKKIPSLFSTYQQKIIMTEQLKLTDKNLYQLPQNLMSTYVLWKDGQYLFDLLPKTTFYRHRKALLEFSIDISITVDKPDESNVIPLMRILEAKPVEIPHWAFTEGLIHKSASNY